MFSFFFFRSFSCVEVDVKPVCETRGLNPIPKVVIDRQRDSSQAQQPPKDDANVFKIIY